MSIEDLCDFDPVQVAPEDFAGELYLGLEHLASGRLRAVSSGNSIDMLSAKLRFKKGDVLYSKLRPYLDKAVLAQSDGVCTSELLVLRPKPGISGRFLAAVVHSPEFIRYAITGVTGAHHPRTSWNHIRTFGIPHFEESEREKISAIAWATHEQLVRCERLVNAAERLKLKAMEDLFTRGLSGQRQKESAIGMVPATWSLAPLEALCETLSGGTPPKSDSSFWNGPIPWVSGKDLKVPRLTDVADHVSESAAREYSKVAPPESLLVLIRGMGLAKRFPVSLIEQAMAFNQDLKALIPNTHVTGPFLLHCLTWAGDRMLANLTTAAHGTKRLSQDDLHRFQIPVPPDDADGHQEQARIVEILDTLDRKVALHNRKAVVLSDLFKSLLHGLMSEGIRVADIDLTVISSQLAEAT